MSEKHYQSLPGDIQGDKHLTQTHGRPKARLEQGINPLSDFSQFQTVSPPTTRTNSH